MIRVGILSDTHLQANSEPFTKQCARSLSENAFMPKLFVV